MSFTPSRSHGYRLQDTPGVLGARFSGGGYGGCCVGLVAGEAAAAAPAAAERVFAAEFPRLASAARFFLAESEEGVRVERGTEPDPR